MNSALLHNLIAGAGPTSQLVGGLVVVTLYANQEPPAKLVV